MPDSPATGPLIEFHAADPSRFPAPFPARLGIPDWVKEMPMDREFAGPGISGSVPGRMPTVKRCPPFLDAMVCGYLIPLAGEVAFRRESSGVLRFKAQGKIVDAQHPSQVKGSPMEGALIVKFINPWVIKTPPGYSTLFLPALNRFDLPFQVLSGLVETDTYYRPVHFPTVCTMRPGTDYTIPRGTPIAQAVPIRREDWQSSAVPWDTAARKEIEQTMLENREDFYKDRHWKKKGYG
jgi:hypothetical protein